MEKYNALSREEVVKVIERKGTSSRVPCNIHFWVHTETFGEKRVEVEEILSRYPEDLQIITLKVPQVFEGTEDNPDYRWVPFDAPQTGTEKAMDNIVALEDWNQLDNILECFPDPYYKGALPISLHDEGKYRLGHWWYGLFERHWSIRGMTNALMDYYLKPQEVHRLYRALTDFYLVLIDRAAKELSCDGIWFSDDLGTQKSTFFSIDIFREFFKPYYQELYQCCRDHEIHSWLHSCGNIETFIPELIDIGLDVLHPIQKLTMEEEYIRDKYGDKLTIFAGMDVQHIIPWGSPDEVRKEVRFLIDTYWRQGVGGCLITAGNGINQDCPLENLEVF